MKCRAGLSSGSLLCAGGVRYQEENRQNTTNTVPFIQGPAHRTPRNLLRNHSAIHPFKILRQNGTQIYIRQLTASLASLRLRLPRMSSSGLPRISSSGQASSPPPSSAGASASWAAAGRTAGRSLRTRSIPFVIYRHIRFKSHLLIYVPAYHTQQRFTVGARGPAG